MQKILVVDDDPGIREVVCFALQKAGFATVIAADGAYSPIKRALKIDSEYNGYSAIAIRSEMHANRPDSDSLDIYLKLAFQGDQLPGYGWVFPMGSGRFNIGLGYVNSYKNWQSINATQFLGEFLRTLPPEWELPPIDELKKNKSVRAWRLPMGFTAWPPWRPGVLFTGDSLGAGKPASGAGISKALESGLAAGECAIAALQNGEVDMIYSSAIPATEVARVGKFRGIKLKFTKVQTAGYQAYINMRNAPFSDRRVRQATYRIEADVVIRAVVTGRPFVYGIGS